MSQVQSSETVSRVWDGAPKWVKTYFVGMDGYGNWSRGETLRECKDSLLKMAGSTTHAHFQKYGLLVYMIRQDESYDAPYVTRDGCLVSSHDPYNPDSWQVIEEIKRKPRK